MGNSRDFVATLAAREQEVLGSIAEGQTNSDIAQQTSISPNTVRDHIVSIFGEFGVQSRPEAAAVLHRTKSVWRSVDGPDQGSTAFHDQP